MKDFGMRQMATVYADCRGSSRLSAERDVTIRDEQSTPFDAIIENISKTGFGMTTSAQLPVGAVVGLRVSGTVRKRAKVVRRLGLAYGCEFLIPLGELEMRTLLQENAVSPANLQTETDLYHVGAVLDPNRDRKLSYLARVYVLFGLVAAAWLLVIWFASTMVDGAFVR